MMTAKRSAAGGESDAPAITGTACRITAREPDVFAAGQRHQPRTAAYPDGWFSEAQLAALMAHPLLDVERVPV